MIFLILSVEGFSEILSVADKTTDKLWLNKATVSEEHIVTAQTEGWQIQIFSEVINVTSEQAIVKAIKYIEKKWPNEAIDVEYL